MTTQLLGDHPTTGRGYHSHTQAGLSMQPGKDMKSGESYSNSLGGHYTAYEEHHGNNTNVGGELFHGSHASSGAYKDIISSRNEDLHSPSPQQQQQHSSPSRDVVDNSSSNSNSMSQVHVHGTPYPTVHATNNQHYDDINVPDEPAAHLLQSRNIIANHESNTNTNMTTPMQQDSTHHNNNSNIDNGNIDNDAVPQANNNDNDHNNNNKSPEHDNTNQNDPRLNSSSRTESFAGMTQSERKRFREKKRRSDITNAIEELTKTVLKVDPSALLGAKNQIKSHGFNSATALDGIITHKNSHQPPNRTEVINHACRLLDKLYKENEQNKFYIEKLGGLINGNQAAQAQLQSEMMYPHQTTSSSMGGHHDTSSRDHHPSPYTAGLSSSAPDVMQHGQSSSSRSSQMHLGSPFSQSPQLYGHHSSSTPSSLMNTIGEHHSTGNAPGGVGGSLGSSSGHHGSNTSMRDAANVPPDQLSLSAALMSQHHSAAAGASGIQQTPPSTTSALLNSMNMNNPMGGGAGGIGGSHHHHHSSHHGNRSSGGSSSSHHHPHHSNHHPHHHSSSSSSQQYHNAPGAIPTNEPSATDQLLSYFSQQSKANKRKGFGEHSY